MRKPKLSYYLNGFVMGMLFEYILRVNHHSVFALAIFGLLLFFMILDVIPNKYFGIK
jgi:hypothetical protein